MGVKEYRVLIAVLDRQKILSKLSNREFTRPRTVQVRLRQFWSNYFDFIVVYLILLLLNYIRSRLLSVAIRMANVRPGSVRKACFH